MAPTDPVPSGRGFSVEGGVGPFTVVKRPGPDGIKLRYALPKGQVAQISWLVRPTATSRAMSSPGRSGDSPG
ncbi:hypothetical protein GCM10009579_21390 [Streptomyces javensis]|uniref:Uncharacterized protein n=1 Tax=Streptomyces javensis TaxID=114698 RepID=A0ABN1WYX3_9ACTN